MNAGEKQVPTPPLSSGKSLANSAADPVPTTTVRDQLARVVNSPGFVSSVRLCRFLTHIVNRTIDGVLDCNGGVRPHLGVRSEHRRDCSGRGSSSQSEVEILLRGRAGYG